jgi:hypothetical protein
MSHNKLYVYSCKIPNKWHEFPCFVLNFIATHQLTKSRSGFTFQWWVGLISWLHPPSQNQYVRPWYLKVIWLSGYTTTYLLSIACVKRLGLDLKFGFKFPVGTKVEPVSSIYIWSANSSRKSEASFVLTAQTKTIERDWNWRPMLLQFPPSRQEVCQNFVFWHGLNNNTIWFKMNW